MARPFPGLRATAVHFLGICLGLISAHSADLPAPRFTTPEASPYVASEAKTAVVWEVPGNTNSFQFELRQSPNESFSPSKIRYQGLDRATYIAGLPAGDFYYRVRITPENHDPGPWSDIMRVQVKYVSLKIVFVLTTLGLFVFVATVLVVLTGHRRTSRAEAAKP